MPATANWPRRETLTPRTRRFDGGSTAATGRPPVTVANWTTSSADRPSSRSVRHQAKDRLETKVPMVVHTVRSGGRGHGRTVNRAAHLKTRASRLHLLKRNVRRAPSGDGALARVPELG